MLICFLPMQDPSWHLNSDSEQKGNGSSMRLEMGWRCFRRFLWSWSLKWMQEKETKRDKKEDRKETRSLERIHEKRIMSKILLCQRENQSRCLLIIRKTQKAVSLHKKPSGKKILRAHKIAPVATDHHHEVHACAQNCQFPSSLPGSQMAAEEQRLGHQCLFLTYR